MSHWDDPTARDYQKLGQQAHLAVIGPSIERLLGDLSGQRVLDFGCGPGQLTLQLAEMGAAAVTGMDENARMIATAREKLSLGVGDRVHGDQVTFDTGDETRLPLGPFDAVLSCLMLMMCGTRERLVVTVDGLMRSLNDSGRLLIIITHPCFRRAGYGTFHYELPQGYDYWDSGRRYEVALTPHDPESVEATLTDHHWTLTDYFNAVAAAGGAITALEELPAQRDVCGKPIGPPAYLAMLARPMRLAGSTPRPPSAIPPRGIT